MKIKTILFWVALILSCTDSYAENEAIINSISKFLILQQMPTKVSSFLCWRTEKIISLMKNLNKNNFLFTNIVWNTKIKYLPKFLPAEHQLYLIDMNCNNYIEILKKASAEKLFNFPYRWIIIENKDTPTDYANIDMFTNSRVYVIQKELDNLYKVESIYKIAKSQALIKNNISVLNDTDLFYYNTISDSRNRSDLMGLKLNISIVAVYKDTLNHWEDGRKWQQDAVSKHNYMLAHYVADSMNITRSLIVHSGWGILIPNTTQYNGMLGDIQSGISEFGGTPSFLTKDRLFLFGYTIAPTTTRGTFIFRAPPLSVVANVYTLPFNIWVWYACYVLMAIIIVVITLIIQWEWRDSIFSISIEGKNNVLRPRFLDIVQMEIGAVFQQGSEAEPKSLSGQIATFTIFLAFMFLYTSYSANIVALLQSTADSITTLEDLLESKIQLGMDSVPYMAYFVKTLTGPLQKAIIKQKLSQPGSSLSLDAGVGKIRTDFFAFFAESNSIYKAVSDTFLETEKCALKEIDFWSIADPHIAVKKNSTFMENINVVYAKMLERGVGNREYRRLYIKKPSCQNQGANFISISISDTYFAFVVFSVGVCVSILIFLLEHIAKKIHDRHALNNVVLLKQPEKIALNKSYSSFRLLE